MSANNQIPTEYRPGAVPGPGVTLGSLAGALGSGLVGAGIGGLSSHLSSTPKYRKGATAIGAGTGALLGLTGNPLLGSTAAGLASGLGARSIDTSQELEETRRQLRRLKELKEARRKLIRDEKHEMDKIAHTKHTKQANSELISSLQNRLNSFGQQAKKYGTQAAQRAQQFATENPAAAGAIGGAGIGGVLGSAIAGKGKRLRGGFAGALGGGLAGAGAGHMLGNYHRQIQRSAPYRSSPLYGDDPLENALRITGADPVTARAQAEAARGTHPLSAEGLRNIALRSLGIDPDTVGQQTRNALRAAGEGVEALADWQQQERELAALVDSLTNENNPLSEIDRAQRERAIAAARARLERRRRAQDVDPSFLQNLTGMVREGITRAQDTAQGASDRLAEVARNTPEAIRRGADATADAARDAARSATQAITGQNIDNIGGRANLEPEIATSLPPEVQRINALRDVVAQWSESGIPSRAQRAALERMGATAEEIAQVLGE